ncbi:MAG: glycosyltransferase [Thermodesulfobacteriota bacterium]|nr:glycosyltransferase [Thermodesulfobacteriota bacterium]
MHNNSTTAKSGQLVDISVLIPISEADEEIEKIEEVENVFLKIREILEKNSLTYEFIFVLDGQYLNTETKLDEIHNENHETVKVIKFNRMFGVAKALTAAFNESSGNLILTHAPYFQVIPEMVQKLFDNFTDDIDMIFGARYPKQDNFFIRLQSKIFHSVVNGLTGESFRDIVSSERLMRRCVMQKVELYGDLHRFIPVLALYHGFNVKEIPLQQAKKASQARIYRPGAYLRRMLDVFTLVFLVKFTQKPLRFFGFWGVAMSSLGFIITAVTVIQRLLFDIALADRPLFFVGTLLILLGIQIFFIGLVAEIILFMHKPSVPHYNIEEKIE